MTLMNATDQFESWGYTTALPIPKEIDLTQRSSYTLNIQQSDVQLGLRDADGTLLTTTVWGYGTGGTGGYLGPTLVAEEGSPLTIKWQNQLPLTGHLLPVDYTLHRANPVMKAIEDGFTPIVTHLHGAETDAAADGYPEAWYTQTKGGPGPAEVGKYYTGDAYTYANDQEAAPLWYHDHALGLTRLNVYAGLAGFYRLTDKNEQSLIKEDVLPKTAIPLVIQDKAFTEDGQLYFPAYEDDPLPDGTGGSGSVGEEVGEDFFADNPEGASALPEFFGDHILVNGAPWPNLEVGLGAVTYELLNGSDSRFYLLDLVEMDGDGIDEVRATIVGTDGGLLPQAVAFDGPVVLAPGDRLEVVIDFSEADIGDQVRLVNTGPDYSPFKAIFPDGTLLDAEAATPEDPVGNIMQFTVTKKGVADKTVSVAPGDILNPDYFDITNGPSGDGVFDNVRKVGLFEGADEYGRVQPLLGTAEAGEFHDYKVGDVPPGEGLAEENGIRDFGPLNWSDPTTETPEVGTTEMWQVFNFTADAHPVHLHLTQYQGIERHEIQFKDEDEDGIPDDTTGNGLISYDSYIDESGIDFSEADIWVAESPIALAPEEGGRQDTLYVPSGPPGEGVEGANIGSLLEIAVHFEKAGIYVWHCHILSHEDHEMMRPMEVTDAAFQIA